jgi:hypothetical protein
LENVKPKIYPWNNECWRNFKYIEKWIW